MIGTKNIDEKKSKHNGILKVIKSWGMGTYIQAEGLTQSGGIVETIWKQTLRKVRYSKPEISNCLILGLGGGTVVKILRKNWEGVKIIGIDIDSEIVKLGKKYLGLDEKAVKIEIKDAGKFIKTHPRGVFYDLIIVDLYNGDKFPQKFESEGFLEKVKSLLSGGGRVVFNRLYYKEKKREADEFGLRLGKVFGNVENFRPASNLIFLCSK